MTEALKENLERGLHVPYEISFKRTSGDIEFILCKSIRKQKNNLPDELDK